MQTTKPLPADPLPVINKYDFNWPQFGLPVNRSFYTMSLTVDESHMGVIIRHVPNTEYIRWLEILAVAHSDSIGYNSKWYKNNNLIWFVRRHEIDYLAQVFTNDKLIMCTWIDSFKKTTALRKFMVCSNKQNKTKVICRAATTWVLVTRDNPKPTRVTNEMVNTFLHSK